MNCYKVVDWKEQYLSFMSKRVDGIIYLPINYLIFFCIFFTCFMYLDPDPYFRIRICIQKLVENGERKKHDIVLLLYF